MGRKRDKEIMPTFSKRSLDKLETCHKDLVRLFGDVIVHYDCTILDGRRDEQAQNHYFNIGRSKKPYPMSKHNHHPSLAVDVAPYPIDWTNVTQFYHFGGFVMGVAKTLGINLRYGGDWDGDMDLRDQTFMDLCHYELIGG